MKALVDSYLRKILAARVYDIAVESPLEHAPKLSRRLNAQLLFKREDQQPQFSFKVRGAFNRISHLTQEQRARGVIAASAGNHAQGVARGAAFFHCPATIYMPISTPDIKVQSVKSLGAEVRLVGSSYDEAYAQAAQEARKSGRTLIHAYDDPLVIAGQGTIGMEILRQHTGPIQAVFCPIGGGGLISGIACYLKALRPSIQIIGVETVDADAMARSIAAGRRITLPHVGQFADGTAVKTVGQETFRICRALLDDIITVTTDELCAAIKDVFEDTRTVLEPSGALAVAGAKKYAATHKVHAAMVAVTSGANMNFDRLRFVAERAEIGEQREMILAVTIDEQPGSFQEFCDELGAINITEFNYRYADPNAAHIFVGVQIHSQQERKRLLKRLRQRHVQVLDLTDSEMAKLHLRHLVGGRAANLKNERLLRFEFPERLGALVKFLRAVGGRWNISLFHYRNHGADYGRVLAGLQVPKADGKKFRAFLDGLGYRYQEETDNDAYRLFLS